MKTTRELLELSQEELKKVFIENFGEEQYEEFIAIEKLTNHITSICNILKIEQIPVVFEKIEEDALLVLEPEPFIKLNRKNINDTISCIKSIAHELRHAYQICTVKNKKHPNYKLFEFEFKNYNKELFKKSIVHYHNSIIEIDAFAFSKYIISYLFGYEIKFKDPSYNNTLDKYINNSIIPHL